MNGTTETRRHGESASNMLPPELRSTLDLLLRAFPGGVSSRDLVPLLALLQQEGEMSIRSIAEVMGEFTGRPAVEFLPKIDEGFTVNVESDPSAIRIRQRLEQHGYKAWLREV